MGSYVITCCSTVDLPKEYFEQNNIPYACYHYILDGEEYLDDLGQSVPYDEFYRRIDGGSMPTTSQINISEFMAFFEPFLQEGKDILHLSMSSGISGTCNSAMNAKEELLAKYPDRTIKVVDSLAASSGYGLLLDKLVEMRDAGKSLGEVYLFAEDNKLKLIDQTKIPDELTYVYCENYQEVMEITAKETELPLDGVKEMYEMYDFDMEIKPSDIESMKKTVEFMKENKMIENDVDIQSLILDIE